MISLLLSSSTYNIGNVTVIEHLLKAGADAMILDEDGVTTLMVSVYVCVLCMQCVCVCEYCASVKY